MPAAVETMAFVGETPWHGLGNQVPQNATVDEMLVAAGLDWEVARATVKFYPKGSKSSVSDETHNVLYRTTDNKVLDVVGPVYEPVQNAEVMEFFREYVEAGEAHIETAGSLNDGKDIWALAKMNASFNAGRDDKVEGYVLLSNPHRYGKSMLAKLTAIRVVCQNTLTMALSGSGAGLRIAHNKKFDGAARADAKEKLGIARERLDALKEETEKLVSLRLDDNEAVKVLIEQFNGRKDEPAENQTRTIKRIFELYKGAGYGATLDTAQDTGWGLLNGVTQYLDHEYGRNQNNRLNNSWFGAGETVKRRTKEALLELAG